MIPSGPASPAGIDIACNRLERGFSHVWPQQGHLYLLATCYGFGRCAACGSRRLSACSETSWRCSRSSAVVTFQLHGTATQVAMVLVSFMAPLAIASPLAGVFVDRWHLKRTMIASDLIRGVLVLGLVFVHDLYAIYAILFTMSVVSAFFVPAQSVAVRTLVPIAGLMAVNGLMSQAQQGSLIVAPSVAGELVQLVGANSCFLYDSFSFFFSAALVMTLTIDRQAPRTESSAVLDSMRQGFGVILKHSTISFVILAMTAGMFAMRCFGALLYDRLSIRRVESLLARGLGQASAALPVRVVESDQA